MRLLGVGSTMGESNFQFTPKYRRDVFLDVEARELCRESFRRMCAELHVGLRVRPRPRAHVSRCKGYGVPYMAQRVPLQGG